MAYGLTNGANTSDRVDVGSDAELDDLTASGVGITLVDWIYPTTLTNGRSLASKADLGTGGYWRWFIANGDEMRFEVDYTTTDEASRSSNANLATGAWRFVAVTYLESQSPKARLFVGDLTTPVAETTYDVSNVGSGTRVSDAAQTVKWGNHFTSGVAGGAFQGHMALSAIYTGVLSLTDIERLRLRTMARLAGCVGSWIWGNGGSVGTQVDLSSSGNDGTVTGATASSTQLPLAQHGALVGLATASRSLVNGGLVRRMR